MRTTLLFVPILLASGCAASAPSDPTWIDDVQPILVANCVRCHGVPTAGGAPEVGTNPLAFRLDKYGSTPLITPISIDTPSGPMMVTDIPGAALSNANIVSRAVTAGDMPPSIPLTDAEKKTLENWSQRAFDNGDPDHPALGERADNQDPTIDPGSLPASATTADAVDLTYAISDPDGDLVDGTVLLRPTTGDDVVVAIALHDGRGTATLDLGGASPGTYDVIVSLTDDLATVERNLGSLDLTAP